MKAANLITMFCTCHQPYQCSPCLHPLSWKPPLTLFCFVRLGLPGCRSLRFPHQNIRCEVHIMNLFIIQSSVFYCFFVLHRPKCLPGHPIVKHVCSPLNAKDQVSHPYKTTGKLLVKIYISVFIFLYSKLENKLFCTACWHVFNDFIRSALNCFIHAILNCYVCNMWGNLNYYVTVIYNFIFCWDKAVWFSGKRLCVKPSTPAGRRVQYKRDRSPTRPSAIPRDPSTSLYKP